MNEHVKVLEELPELPEPETWTCHCNWHEESGYSEDQMREYARAAIAALKTQRPGWVMVPVEPTDEMLDAGWSAGDFHIMHYDGIDKPGTPRYSLRRSYAAMLAAAQESANG